MDCGVESLIWYWAAGHASAASFAVSCVSAPLQPQTSRIQRGLLPTILVQLGLLLHRALVLILPRRERRSVPTEFKEIPLPFSDLWSTGPTRKDRARTLRRNYPAGSPLCAAGRPRRVILNVIASLLTWLGLGGSRGRHFRMVLPRAYLC